MESMAPVFIRSLALVWRSVTVSAADLTPLESFLFYLRIGTGPSPSSILYFYGQGEIESAVQGFWRATDGPWRERLWRQKPLFDRFFVSNDLHPGSWRVAARGPEVRFCSFNPDSVASPLVSSNAVWGPPA